MIITNSELTEKLKSLVSSERKITKAIIESIAEVDRRKLYLEMAYPSLFEYLTKEIGYSPSAAQRRIDAARLFQQVPTLTDKIATGSVNLSQISQLQSAFRAEQKKNVEIKNASPYSPQRKLDLVKKLENKSPKETESIIAQEFGFAPKNLEKLNIQSDLSARIEFTLSAEEFKKLEEAKSLLAHALPGATTKEILVYLADKFIKQRVKIKNEIKASENSTAAAVVTAQNRTSDTAISTAVRKFIFNRDCGCQFRNPRTGKICNSKYFLEIDHIQPKWASGNNEPSNLRLLCGAHNRFRYQTGK
jgi:hypothetical protein